jgi:hypothetical protein
MSSEPNHDVIAAEHAQECAWRFTTPESAHSVSGQGVEMVAVVRHVFDCTQPFVRVCACEITTPECGPVAHFRLLDIEYRIRSVFIAYSVRTRFGLAVQPVLSVQEVVFEKQRVSTTHDSPGSATKHSGVRGTMTQEAGR